MPKLQLGSLLLGAELMTFSGDFSDVYIVVKSWRMFRNMTFHAGFYTRALLDVLRAVFSNRLKTVE
jgi:hypothetical protein